jgi:hypothetical protein
MGGLNLDSHLLLKLLSHCTDNNAEGVGISVPHSPAKSSDRAQREGLELP